jgi:hypothetical protein
VVTRTFLNLLYLDKVLEVARFPVHPMAVSSKVRVTTGVPTRLTPKPKRLGSEAAILSKSAT